ncbi:MAG: hypothetical protein NTY87_08980 [Planctomycetia bacterium]|nr:hypothetical protein [Planctomycetia bacterium]
MPTCEGGAAGTIAASRSVTWWADDFSAGTTFPDLVLQVFLHASGGKRLAELKVADGPEQAHVCCRVRPHARVCCAENWHDAG